MKKNRNRKPFSAAAGACLLLFVLCGCMPTVSDLKVVEYTPHAGADWLVSSPEAVGMDPLQIAILFYNAERLDTIRSLLVIRDGYLIARIEKGSDKGSDLVFCCFLR